MTDHRRPRKAHVAAAALILTAFISTSALADEAPDCSDELEMIPRDGSTVVGDEIFASYSGSAMYAGLANARADEIEVDGPSEPDLSDADHEELGEARSFAGAKLQDLSEGEYRWSMRGAPEARFTVEDADSEMAAPTIDDGDVVADVELLVYEGFPVIFRQWSLSFPSAKSETTQAENLRYLVEFSWGGEEDPISRQILVTPTADAKGDTVEVELGGHTERCRHAEPEAPLTEVTDIAVYAVDVAGNLSEKPARGVFDGVSEEKLADAYEEFNEVIAKLEEDSDGDVQTTEEVVAELEAEEEQEADDEGRCSTVGGGPAGGGLLLILLAMAAARAKSVYARRQRSE